MKLAVETRALSIFGGELSFDFNRRGKEETEDKDCQREKEF